MSSGGDGGGTRTAWRASPEQRRLMRLGTPMLWRLGAAARGQIPDWQLWEVPRMPETPAPVLPTEGWFQDIAPEVMAGIMEPYKMGERYLEEKFGAAGGLGSARGGYSGAGGAALGRYWGTAMPQIGAQAWQMTAPELMRYGQQRYAGQMQRRGEVMQRGQAPYTLGPGYLGSLGQLTPTGVTTPTSGFSPTGFLGAGAIGGAMPAIMGANPLLGIPLGLGMGLMGGFGGGK